MTPKVSKVDLISSPAVVVRADSSIREAVAKMKLGGVGAVLVISDDGRGDLAGIFTERDLVQKIDLIHGGHWDKPVRTVMTHPARTIDVSDLEGAGELMLDLRCRHLPVVRTSKTGQREILGMISMRDLFLAQLRRHREEQRKGIFELAAGGELEGRIAVVEMGDAISLVLKSAFLPVEKAEVKSYRPSEAIGSQKWLKGLIECAALVFDIDGLPPAEWTSLLKELNLSKDLPKVFLIFDRERHQESELRVLFKLSESRQFTPMSKPINVSALLLQIIPLMMK